MGLARPISFPAALWLAGGQNKDSKQQLFPSAVKENLKPFFPSFWAASKRPGEAEIDAAHSGSASPLVIISSRCSQQGHAEQVVDCCQWEACWKKYLNKTLDCRVEVSNFLTSLQNQKCTVMPVGLLCYCQSFSTLTFDSKAFGHCTAAHSDSDGSRVGAHWLLWTPTTGKFLLICAYSLDGGGAGSFAVENTRKWNKGWLWTHTGTSD